MANGTELRGIALEILLEITQEKEYSHLAIRNALNKVQYLPKQDRVQPAVSAILNITEDHLNRAPDRLCSESVFQCQSK